MTKIKLISNALSEEYCQKLIHTYTRELSPAMFWSAGVRTFDPEVRYAFNYKTDIPIINQTSIQLASALSNQAIDEARTERSEVVCYPPGCGNERHIDGPLRSHSIVYFMNTGYEGGELVFDSGESFHGLGTGSAVIWENTDTSFHACSPITRGFKWIVVSWIGREVGRDDQEPQTDKVDK